MHKIISYLLLIHLCYTTAKAQDTTNQRHNTHFLRNNNDLNEKLHFGHLYGKIIDYKTNKPIESVTVQLFQIKYDSVIGTSKNILVATIVTTKDGYFDLHNLPLLGKLSLSFSSVGYNPINRPFSFDIKPILENSSVDMTTKIEQIQNIAEKDLGNIKLTQNNNNLGNVVVTSVQRQFELGVDKKIFNVDQNILSTGQTATEVMKNIPLVNVDINGNITVRGGSPTIFVDGRPTTLTLDQIPADIIDKVELITNPSAKYDASGGQGGILNIILKKDKKVGYNGGVRGGVDSRGRINVGSDFSYRTKKWTLSTIGVFRQRRTIINGNSQYNQTATPPVQVNSVTKSTTDGNLGFIRAALDFAPNIRNTYSTAGNFAIGTFFTNGTQSLDSSFTLIPNRQSLTYRPSAATYNFSHFSGSLSYKHIFPNNNDHTLTADINYNGSNNFSNTNYNSTNYLSSNLNQPLGNTYQNIKAVGFNHYFTAQSDYSNPTIYKDSKLDAGVRAAIRYTGNNSTQGFANQQSPFAIVPILSVNYLYTDQTYAAYTNFTSTINKKWNYSGGLRLETYDYYGVLLNQKQSFKVQYPINLFPSAFLSYNLTKDQQLQLNYSRRIDRPNFFQLVPYYNFSNLQSPQIGNPNLQPQFTESVEFNYNINYGKSSNFLATIYFKYTNNIIVQYQYRDKNLSPYITNADSITYTTFTNASYAINYGLELTNTMTVTKWWDYNINVNLYNSSINGNNVKVGTIGTGLISWFGKINNNFKFAKTWSGQFSMYYQSRTVIPTGGSQGGNGSYGNTNTPLSQGYILPRYSFDAAIKKDFKWKNGNTASITLAMSDIFRTAVYQTSVNTNFFSQNSLTRRDPQVVTLNFSWRFGKFNNNQAPKKKNTNIATTDIDSGGGIGAP